MQLDYPVSASLLDTLRTGAAVIPDSPTVLAVEGPGALACLQGLLTNDLVAPGDGSLTYGAILTNKGMIVLDPFVLRESGAFVMILPAFARETALGHLTRMLPPRLARVTDRTGAWAAAWLAGPMAGDGLERAGSSLPAPGRVARLDPGGVLMATGRAPMPFTAMLVGPSDRVGTLVDRCQEAGSARGEEAWLAAARVLAGWPSLGREIDERTLPQEVRYDELGAVSYDKGCYTGQETVARVHFRGHPNRILRAVTLEGGGSPGDRTLRYDGREVGMIRTALLLENRVLALATVRREVPDEAVLRCGDREARLAPLPLATEVAV